MDLQPKELKEWSHKVKTIASEELNYLLESEEDVLLLDVRSEREFSGDVNPIEGAILIPISELENRTNELKNLVIQKLLFTACVG
jgi:rhodanese-related sulfurtransferase